MVVLFSATIISCSQAIQLLNNVASVAGLNDKQKIEIITEIRQLVPSCPVKIEKDKNGKSKKSSN
jgi:hypothetical protein